MQDSTAPAQPKMLAPAIRFGLAAIVALAFTGVLAVATSASHTALRNVTAQMQDTTRYVKLPPVEIVGRRELALADPAALTRSTAVASTGCLQPS